MWALLTVAAAEPLQSWARATEVQPSAIFKEPGGEELRRKSSHLLAENLHSLGEKIHPRSENIHLLIAAVKHFTSEVKMFTFTR